MKNKRHAVGLVALLSSGAVPGGSAAQEQILPVDVGGSAQRCEVVREVTLPAEVSESSGLARSTRDPAVFWTHNDAGNAAELFGVNEEGGLVQRVRVTGAELVDWEDIEAGRCGDANCLYIGDIGDNDGERTSVTVYRIPEPAAGARASDPAQALHARYPDGPRDAEALFADDSGRLHIVTKGRGTAVTLYRWPAAGEPGPTVTLERVRDLFPEPANERDRVTSATATPDGRWIGIRTYRTLHLYRAAELLGGGDARSVALDLGPLAQSQGESLVLADDGSVWASSEAEGGGQPRLSHLQCSLPAQSDR